MNDPTRNQLIAAAMGLVFLLALVGAVVAVEVLTKGGGC